ncbi:NUDIX domain-containing protein [Streptomyces sp. OV198]|nr:NUDIX domain-containing protein [Streptomyces sp. OV198]
MAQRTTDDQHKALKPALESMTLLVAAVIVHDQATNRVVLLQRSQNAKFAQGMWDLPVGKSEPGEPVTETAARELFEETGLAVKPEALKVAHIIHGAWGVEAPNGFLTVVFTTHEWTGEPENREPHKHARFAGSTPTPSPRSSWTPPPAPSTATSPAAPKRLWTADARPCIESMDGPDDVMSRSGTSVRR